MSEVRALGVMVEPPVRTESAGDHRVHRGRLCPCQEHDDCGRQGLGCDGIRAVSEWTLQSASFPASSRSSGLPRTRAKAIP